MSGSTKKALDLLLSSIEKNRDAGSEEWELLGSTLQASGLWTDKGNDLLSKGKTKSPAPISSVVWPLSLLSDVIANCSPDQLHSNSPKWTEAFTKHLKDATDVTLVKTVCKCLSALLDRSRSLQKGMSEFVSRQLPSIMCSLLWFTAAEPCIQCTVLPLVTKCFVYYPSSCGQFKGQLTKWANTGMFSSSRLLSRECSRLIVIVTSQRTTLIESLVKELHKALSTLYDKNDPEGSVGASLIEILSIGTEEPRRSSLLLRQVAVLTRTLCYSLLFPPHTNGVVPLSIPVDRLVGVVLFGMEGNQQQVSGLSYDQLMLHAMIPVIHMAMWNVLVTLIKTCHVHLLSYATPIESSITQGLIKEQKSVPLSLSIHTCLRVWLSIRRDTDRHYFNLIIDALVKQAKEDSKYPPCVQLSALTVLSTIVRAVGPILPGVGCKPISQLPLKGFSLTTPPDLAVCLLDLLLTCLTSSNKSLCPNVGGAISVFRMGTRHHSSKVNEFCAKALVYCELMQHPVAPPILSPLGSHGNAVQALRFDTDNRSRPVDITTFTNSLSVNGRPQPQTIPIKEQVQSSVEPASSVSVQSEPALIIDQQVNPKEHTSMHTHNAGSLHYLNSVSTNKSLTTASRKTTSPNPEASNEAAPVITPRRWSIGSDSSTEDDFRLFVNASPDHQ